MAENVRTSLIRGLDWLVKQQSADGGWNSTTYGQLKDGAAVTALALSAISHADDDWRKAHRQTIERGFGFLDRGLAKRGTIASPDGTLDFPTYAAALWLMAGRRFGPDEQSQSRRQIVIDYLLNAQVAKARGFEPDSPSYGGWDFLGRDDARAITTGTNMSITCYVVEALAGVRSQESGVRSQAIDLAMGLAKAYVLRCQQADGGFAFTCEPASLNNKAAYRDEKLKQPRPYGTATCDGVRALVACGLKPTDEPVAKGLTWLANRPGLEIVPGFEGLAAEFGWQRGLRYYYYASLSKVLPHLPDRGVRTAALHEQLLSQQKPDGSWTNESDRMRENDPLVATPLALEALVGVSGN